MLFTSIFLISLPQISSSILLWPYLFFVCYFAAMVWPSATALVSNSVSPAVQGEVLGVLASVNSLAYAISPLCSGTSVGAYPAFPMVMGGAIMFVSALIILGIYRLSLFQLPSKKEEV
jgi:MFS family permease